MKILKKSYLACLTFVLCLTIAGAFGLLWMRQQVYLQASYGQKLENTLSNLQKRIQRLDLRIAQINSNKFLVRQAQLALQQPTKAQILGRLYIQALSSSHGPLAISVYHACALRYCGESLPHAYASHDDRRRMVLQKEISLRFL